MTARRIARFVALLVLFVVGSAVLAWDDLPVDFGDSGEVVVVEPGDDDESSDGTTAVYWFPDEFRDYIPPIFGNLPSPPAGGGGDGGGDDPEVDCEALHDELEKVAGEVNILYGQVAYVHDDLLEERGIEFFYELTDVYWEVRHAMEELMKQIGELCPDSE